ncbi:MAG: zf-TFIIB domain-containing protein [Leptolyngbyaceae cyanobacterium MAG.088]|nr:zf-TFIIB domain-containing protein [Leptolyngbyaceae cyanobacterium MAG.088]
MPEAKAFEPRYNCPVCSGLPMQKLKITQKNGGLLMTLDCCQRCGGVWFDKDEVKLSQQIISPKIRQRITQKPRRWKSHCHQCNALIDRNLKSCDTCGWTNQVSCPVCEKSLERKHHKHLILDICHSCQGVWFDQVELLALWNGPCLGITHSSESPTTPTQPTQHHTENVVTQAVGEAVTQGAVDGIFYGADILEPGAQLIAETASNAAQRGVNVVTNTPEIAGGIVESLAEVTGAALESIPEVATVMLEGTGEVAGGMTEVLAEVIGALFSS